MLKMMFGDLKMILMQNKDNMPFNAPAKIGGIKYNRKKSVTELKVRTKQRPCPDFEKMQMAINSRPKWLRITGTSAFNNENPLQKIYGMVEDISDRKNNELLKQDFLAMVERL
jgi:hypothetical protein